LGVAIEMHNSESNDVNRKKHPGYPLIITTWHENIFCHEEMTKARLLLKLNNFQ